MSDVVIQGLFILGAAIISGATAIIGYWSGAQVAKLKEDNARLNKQVNRFLRQIEAYHLLEDLYAEELSSAGPVKAPKTVKTDYRKVVEIHQCERPAMTANDAKKLLQERT